MPAVQLALKLLFDARRVQTAPSAATLLGVIAGLGRSGTLSLLGQPSLPRVKPARAAACPSISSHSSVHPSMYIHPCTSILLLNNRSKIQETDWKNHMKLTKLEDPLPSFAVPIANNPFKVMAASKIWARAGTRRSNNYEVVILLKNGLYLRGSFLKLPGFFDVGSNGVKPRKALFDHAIDGDGNPPKKSVE